MLHNYLNIRKNPVRDYRSVENRFLEALHAVRYATSMLKIGCIPNGMQWFYEIQFSTERHIPMECSIINYTIFNLSLQNLITKSL